ncbi:MAG TPA: class II aldolase/adducin family protein [Gaiellaceae bacterium]|nr:class II aldolase/adducin family protein [Gaiellaceae bacterium]
MSASVDELREDVAVGCRILELEGQGDFVWGHVSVRDPENRGVWMKASTFGFDEITPEHVVLVSWEGEVLEGDHRRHWEYPIHTRLLTARDDVHAVVHTHPPWAVAFGSLDVPLRPISREGVMFVPPDIARFTQTSDLIVTDGLGDDLADVVGDRNAALMVNHGIVTCGVDVPMAVMTAVLLERACLTNMRAYAAGGPAIWSSDEETLAKRERISGGPSIMQTWDYLKRRLQSS